MKNEDDFKEMIQKIISHYELSPSVAELLLERILKYIEEQTNEEGKI